MNKAIPNLIRRAEIVESLRTHQSNNTSLKIKKYALFIANELLGDLNSLIKTETEDFVSLNKLRNEMIKKIKNIKESIRTKI